MTKLEQVYHKICNDDKIKNMIKNQVYQNHLRDDFYQEIILKLLEFEDTNLLIEFYDKNILERFIIKMCRYSLSSTKIEENGVRRGGGDFYIKFLLNKTDILDNNIDKVDTTDIEKDLDVMMITDKIDGILLGRSMRDLDKHYHNLLFSLFRNGLSYSDISKQTGLNYHSVRYSVQKTLKMLRNRL